MFDRTGRRSRLDCDFGVTPMVGRHRMDRGATAGAFTDNDIRTLDIHQWILLTAMPMSGGLQKLRRARSKVQNERGFETASLNSRSCTNSPTPIPGHMKSSSKKCTYLIRSLSFILWTGRAVSTCLPAHRGGFAGSKAISRPHFFLLEPMTVSQ